MLPCKATCLNICPTFPPISSLIEEAKHSHFHGKPISSPSHSRLNMPTVHSMFSYGYWLRQAWHKICSVNRIWSKNYRTSKSFHDCFWNKWVLIDSLNIFVIFQAVVWDVFITSWRTLVLGKNFNKASLSKWCKQTNFGHKLRKMIKQFEQNLVSIWILENTKQNCKEECTIRIWLSDSEKNK